MSVDQLVSAEAARKTYETIAVALDAARVQIGQRRHELLPSSLHAVSKLDVISQWERQHQSVWAQLCGSVLAELSEWEPSAAADMRAMFVSAAALYARNGKAWLAWGKFLYRAYLGLSGAALPHALGTCAPLGASKDGLDKADWKSVARAAAGPAQGTDADLPKRLTQQAASAYIMDVSYRVAHAAVELGRLLALGVDERVSEVMSRSSDDFGGGVPSWTWLLWLPTIVALLSSHASRAAQFSLIIVARRYPQAVYFLIRLKRRERRAALQSLKVRNVLAGISVIELPNNELHLLPAGTSEKDLAVAAARLRFKRRAMSGPTLVEPDAPDAPFPELGPDTRLAEGEELVAGPPESQTQRASQPLQSTRLQYLRRKA